MRPAPATRPPVAPSPPVHHQAPHGGHRTQGYYPGGGSLVGGLLGGLNLGNFFNRGVLNALILSKLGALGGVGKGVDVVDEVVDVDPIVDVTSDIGLGGALDVGVTATVDPLLDGGLGVSVTAVTGVGLDGGLGGGLDSVTVDVNGIAGTETTTISSSSSSTSSTISPVL